MTIPHIVVEMSAERNACVLFICFIYKTGIIFKHQIIKRKFHSLLELEIVSTALVVAVGLVFNPI